MVRGFSSSLLRCPAILAIRLRTFRTKYPFSYSLRYKKTTRRIIIVIPLQCHEIPLFYLLLNILKAVVA